jgi:hypothetical protein
VERETLFRLLGPSARGGGPVAVARGAVSALAEGVTREDVVLDRGEGPGAGDAAAPCRGRAASGGDLLPRAWERLGDRAAGADGGATRVPGRALGAGAGASGVRGPVPRYARPRRAGGGGERVRARQGGALAGRDADGADAGRSARGSERAGGGCAGRCRADRGAGVVDGRDPCLLAGGAGRPDRSGGASVRLRRHGPADRIGGA